MVFVCIRIVILECNEKLKKALKPSAVHIAFLVQASLLLPLMTFGRGFVQNIYEFHVSHSKLSLLALLPSFCFHFTTFCGTII